MDQFVGEIRVFGFEFPPRGWAHCDGQLLLIQQNTALFALLGTMYGGDGKSTFALPDLRARGVIGPGQGSGLSMYAIAETVGSSTVTLEPSQIPPHSHEIRVSTTTAELKAPGEQRVIARSSRGTAYRSAGTTRDVTLAPDTLHPTGGSIPHENRQPLVGLNYCIALHGIFPSRP